MDQQPNKLITGNYHVEEEYTFRKALLKRKDDLAYLWKYRFRLLLIMLFACVVGALTAWLWPKTYTARLTFVVEESKPGGGSLVSALAGQFGFDMGSMGGSNGILAGDNVQQLLKSSKLVKNTLLTSFPGKAQKSLADKYSEAYGFKQDWQSKYLPEGQTLSFPVTGIYSRLQDSLVQVMSNQIIGKELSIAKPDKKLSFFELSITSRNDTLSKLFCERIMKEASGFYIKTKTEKLSKNVNRLQQRADSLERILNRKTYSASAANQILLDINPAYSTANVSSELKERDKLVLSTIYSEVVKNLEVSKSMLVQETPAFQLVDEPEYPLKKNRLGYGKSMAVSMFLMLAVASVFLLLKREQQAP